MIPSITLTRSTTAPALVVPVLAGQIPHAYAQAASADAFTGAPGTICEIFAPPGRILLTGLDEAAGACAAARLLRTPHIAIDAAGFPAATAAALATGAALRAWRFTTLRTYEEDDAPRLAAIDLLSDDPALPALWPAAHAAIEGAALARDLVSEPANRLTPTSFAAHLAPLAAAGISIEILDQAALTTLGCGGLLAVGRASAHPPCLAILRWSGQGGSPIAFVGKGITFDTGGISIKPAEAMWDMRADMAGAAACAGAMLTLARRGSPAAAIAILPLAENTTGAAAYRPGDVLHMLNGTTVQVVDTDAEGRLVLADALDYARRQSPRAIIDLATLTGSIVTALGHHMAGAFTNTPGLLAKAQAAGQAVGEPIWPMPIADSHRRALDSDIADIKHCVDGSGHPDACQAAAFLETFAGDTPWLHLDIAGMEQRDAATDEHPTGATGFGVRLLDRLVADHFEAHHG